MSETTTEYDSTRVEHETEMLAGAILLTGEGRAYSAGVDVSGGLGGSESVTGQGVDSSGRGQTPFVGLRESDFPVVAGIEGYALGAGWSCRFVPT